MSRYLAFISYRHKERDKKIAGLLRRGLENWRLPPNAPYDRKNRRVFRDTDELPTSANLGADIENALEESQWLIAICSEDYVQSKWCLREIEMFIDLGRKDKILPVLVGENAEVCIPDIIKDLPIVTKIEKNENADKAIAALLARMAEETTNDASRYLRAEKSNRVLKYSAITVASVAVILGIGIYANMSAVKIAENNEKIQKATEETIKAEQEAKEERNNAILMNAKMLSSEAWKTLNNGDSNQAISLALSALPDDLHGDEPVSDEAVSALRAALSSPNKPVDEWKYTKSIITDFDIKGYQSDYNLATAPAFLLLDGLGEIEDHVYYCSTDEIVLQEGISRLEARELGYGMGLISSSGSYHFYYDSGNKLISSFKGSIFDAKDGYMYKDNYIYADHVYESSGYVLTWLQDPQEGKESPTCLINVRKQEAIGALDIKGKPISASFSDNCKRIAIVDEAGVLSVFDTKDAKKVAIIPGTWESVYYPCSNNKIVCIDSDGNGYLYDAITFSQIYRFDSPSKIRSLQYCNQRSIYLALCEDMIRIFDNTEGKVLSEIPFSENTNGEMPNYVVFESYEEYLWQHEGNAFYVIYDRQVDKYTLNTDIDLTQTDYIPLYHEGLFSTCSKAFYSKDSKYVYRQEYHGELSKWDAKTGDFIWANEEQWTLQGNVHENAIESIDGKYIWRASNYMDGIEKVDGETGKTIYSVVWKEQTNGTNHILMPVETNGKIAVCPCQFSPELVGFDKNTGEFLWYVEDAGEVFGFSKDEKQLYAFNKFETDNEVQLVRRVINLEDGRILKNDVLYAIPKEYDTSFRLIYEREKGVLAFKIDVKEWKTPEKTEDEYTDYVITFDVSTGEKLDQWEIDKSSTFVFSYDGRMAVYWTEKEDDDEYCMELLPNGKLGDITRVQTEEGRKLTTTDYSKIDSNSSFPNGIPQLAFGRFCGDDVILEYFDMSEKGKVTRVSDGSVMIDLPSTGIYQGISLAPDGSGCVIYGYYTNPRIILASDADSLVEKAKKKLEGESQ